MTVENPQRVTINGILFKLCREAIVLVPYIDGKYKTGLLIGQPKWSQGGGSQTNYSVDPPRAVTGDDPPITLREALRWSLLAIEERERTVNRSLTVDLTPSKFDALVCAFYQKGNVPLPDGRIFLKTVCGFFNAGDSPRALASFMFFNSGADNVPTDGHTGRRADEIRMAYGNYGDLSQVSFWANGNPRTTARSFLKSSELATILRELAPDRA